MRKLQKSVIADDNRISRMVLRELLEQRGVQVHEAGDGEAAWELIERERPDLVVSDVLMPRCDGFTLATRIEEAGLDPAPLLFLMTAVYKTNQWRQEAHRTYHAHEYLTKPVEAAAFEAALRRHFDLEGVGAEPG